MTALWERLACDESASLLLKAHRNLYELLDSKGAWPSQSILLRQRAGEPAHNGNGALVRSLRSASTKARQSLWQKLGSSRRNCCRGLTCDYSSVLQCVSVCRHWAFVAENCAHLLVVFSSSYRLSAIVHYPSPTRSLHSRILSYSTIFIYFFFNSSLSLSRTDI